MKRIVSLVLTLAMLLSTAAFTTAVVSAENAAAAGKYKPLDISNGANSKLFIPADGNVGTYTPYLDYFDQKGTNSGQWTAAFDPNGAVTSESYTKLALGLVSTNIRNLSADGTWTDNMVNNIPYQVDLSGKQIKVYNYADAADATAEQKAITAQARSVTIDIANGIYSKLWLMISSSYARTRGVVIYTDGTADTVFLNSQSSEWKGTPNWQDSTTQRNYGTPKYLDSSVTTTPSAEFFGSMSLSADTNKVVDKVKIESTNAWGTILIPAITAEIAAPDEVVAGLPAAESITDANVAEIKTELSYLDEAFAAHAKTEADLTAENQTKLAAIRAKISELASAVLATTEKVQINIQNGAKSKIYLPTSSSTDSNYVAFRDYPATNLANNNPITAATYRSKASHLVLSADKTVTVDGVSYSLKPTDKAVVLRKYNVDLTDATEEEKKAAAELDTAAIDIANDAYSTLYFLGYTSNSVPEGNVPAPRFTIHYTDGTAETKDVAMGKWVSSDLAGSYYDSALYPMGDGGVTTWSKFKTCAISVEAGKVVDKIDMQGTGNMFYHQIFLAMTGEKASAAQMLEKVDARVTAANYRTQKELLAAISNRLTELGVAEESLEADVRTKLENARNAVAAYEAAAGLACTELSVRETEEGATAAVSAKFTNNANAAKSAVVVIVEYKDDKSVNKVTVHPVTVAANALDQEETISYSISTGITDVRAFVWSSMDEMKPLCASEGVKKN